MAPALDGLEIVVRRDEAYGVAFPWTARCCWDGQAWDCGGPTAADALRGLHRLLECYEPHRRWPWLAGQTRHAREGAHG